VSVLPAGRFELLADAFCHQPRVAAVLVIPIQPAPGDVLAHHHHQLPAVRVLANDGPPVPGGFANDPQDVFARRREWMQFAQADGMGAADRPRWSGGRVTAS
jgi:hypothetical protein